MRTYWFPHKEFDYKRTPEFIKERYGKSSVWDACMAIGARSPGEAIMKYRKYVEYGQAIGAYEW